MDKPEIKCPICNEMFVQKRPNMMFCSKNCAMASANRAARARAKGKEYKIKRKRYKRTVLKFECPHNGAIDCERKKCSTCGWNPDVAKMRLEALYG